MKSKLFTKVKKNTYFKNVLVLISGTAGAQLLILVSSPLLTRIYSPEGFGLLAIFMAIVSSVQPSATGRYEIASMLPRSDKIGLEILILSLWCSFVSGFIFFCIVILFPEQITYWVNEPRIKSWLFFVPIVFLVVGWYTALTYLANRTMQYHLISISKFVQSVSIIFFSIILGWFGFKFSGLLLASIIGPIFALIFIFYVFKTKLLNADWKWSKRKFLLAKKYKDYPIYNALPSILNGITMSLPVFYISNQFSLEDLGYFALVSRVIRTPMSLIASAIMQVNIKAVVDLFHSKQSIEKHIYRTAIALLIMSLFPVIIFGFWGPKIFSLIFGVQWAKAGVFGQIMIFALSIRFISSSLSSSIGATNNSHLSAIWRIIALLSTAGVLFLFQPYNSVENTLIVLVVNDIILYSLFFWLIIKAVKKPRI